MSDAASAPQDQEARALRSAFVRLLEPLAKLAVSKGLPYAAVDEWFRGCLVKAAYEAHPELPPHRRASRVSAATGLHRREVQRLLTADAADAPAPSLAAEVFTHWRTDPAYLGPDRRPRILPRVGPAPSFETLAHAITRDVHPRTLLDELLRLNLAQRNDAADTVELTKDGFVPQRDLAHMVAFLGDNVGDHLAGAVNNVLGDGPRHFEQAIYAGNLTEGSIEQVRALIKEQWKGIADALVPRLESFVASDAAVPAEVPRQRVRVGLYSFQAGDTVSESDAGAEPPTHAARPKATSRSRSEHETESRSNSMSSPRGAKS